MTWFSIKKEKIQGFGKLSIIKFLFLLLSVLEIEAVEIRFVESNKLKIIQKPNYLEICRKNDPNFDQCLKSSLEKFMKSVNKGSSEYEIPSIDPVEIPFLKFDETFENFTCNVVCKNLTVTGFKNFKILNINSNVEDYKFEISLETPNIGMEANLFSECDLYAFTIPVEGLFSLNLTNVFAVLIIKLSVYEHHSELLNYFNINESVMEILPVNVNMNFENYLEKNNNIDFEFKNFFNKNAQELFFYLKSPVQKILGKISEAIANEILSRHPQKTLLPD